MKFNADSYLARIGLDAVSADLSGLAKLHEAQQLAIPFENLDPLLGITPALGLEAIAAKMVAEKRGGYCFELNGLFEAALAEFRFAARRVGARVRMGAPVGGPRSHLAFVVTIGGNRHLADVGFGGPGFRLPFLLDTAAEQTQGDETFRARPDAATGETVIEKKAGDGWFALYSFDMAEFSDADIEVANFVCANWPKAPFPSHLMMNIRTPKGRVSMFDRDVTMVEDGAEAKQRIGTAAELRSVLSELFRVEPDAGTVEAAARRLGLEGAAKAA